MCKICDYMSSLRYDDHNLDDIIISIYSLLAFLMKIEFCGTLD